MYMKNQLNNFIRHNLVKKWNMILCHLATAFINEVKIGVVMSNEQNNFIKKQVVRAFNANCPRNKSYRIDLHKFCTLYLHQRLMITNQANWLEEASILQLIQSSNQNYHL